MNTLTKYEAAKQAIIQAVYIQTHEINPLKMY